MRVSPTIVIAVLAIGFVASVPVAAQTPPASSADLSSIYAGAYRYVGSEQERSRVGAAIERATDGMVFFIRPIANARIRDANPVPGMVTIRFPPGQIEVLAITNRPWRSPANGAAVQSQGVQGDRVMLTSRWENGHLVQVISVGQDWRRNEYILGEDGQTLTLRVMIHSDRLPRPVRYELTYRR